MTERLIELYELATRNEIGCSAFVSEILSLKAENTEVVSSADSESSVYTDVRESHASGDTEQPQALVEGALEKITDTERAECRNPHGCACKMAMGDIDEDCSYWW